MSNHVIEILNKFITDSQDCREYLKRPFIKGGFIYASNGHIAVRIPKQDGIDAGIECHVPQIEKLFQDNERSNFLSQLVALPEPVNCGFCNGLGISYKCTTCKGLGSFDKGGYEYACRTCDETGEVQFGKEKDKRDCFECSGYGHKPQRVKVGKTGYDSRYLSVIYSLPDIKFSPHPTDNSLPGYFKFDGGDGLIMPRRK